MSRPRSDVAAPATYLEAPMAHIGARQRFAPDIDPRVTDLRRTLDAMALDLLRAVYPGAAEHHVSADELGAHGFDPDRREPDPDDYW